MKKIVDLNSYAFCSLVFRSKARPRSIYCTSKFAKLTLPFLVNLFVGFVELQW